MPHKKAKAQSFPKNKIFLSDFVWDLKLIQFRIFFLLSKFAYSSCEEQRRIAENKN
jgi:hypothetical protein